MLDPRTPGSDSAARDSAPSAVRNPRAHLLPGSPRVDDASEVRRLLEACARPNLGVCAERVRELARGDLPRLAECAAWEGMASLVHAHLREAGVDHPELRPLRGYVLRDEVEAREREDVLRQALRALRGTPVILLKGAALARTVYRSAAHRRMDDLDLQVPPEAIDDCRRRLLAAGFGDAPTHDDADDGNRPHHAAPVSLGGVVVELHRYFPAGGIAQTWDEVFQRAVPFEGLEGVLVPCPAHLLWQVWHHTFRGSLRWRRWTLLGVADLVGLLERGGIDWSLVGRMPGLASLHELTPLSPAVLSELGGDPEPLAAGGTVYRGWPHTDSYLARETRSPPAWWLRLRHGIRGEPLWRCRLDHLRDLVREYYMPWRETTARRER